MFSIKQKSQKPFLQDAFGFSKDITKYSLFHPLIFRLEHSADIFHHVFVIKGG